MEKNIIHTCMKQDQSYFRQVFYLREDNFGLNYKKNIAFKISYKIVALFTENYPSLDATNAKKHNHYFPLISLFLWL